MQDTEHVTENQLDIKSPYIKTFNQNLEEIRKKIAEKKANFEQNISFSEKNSNSEIKNKNQISRLNFADMRNEIEKVSKRVVGGEIKKFAEMAGKEIENELTSFEERLVEDIDIKILNIETKLENNLSQKIGSEIKSKSENLKKEFENKIKSEISKIRTEKYDDTKLFSKINEIKEDLKTKTSQIETGILETIVAANSATEEEFENINLNFEDKFALLNQKISELEDRLNSLEIYSVENVNEIKEDIENINPIIQNTDEYIHDNDYTNDEAKQIEVKNLETDSEPVVIRHDSIDNDLTFETDEENYIENKLKNIINLFNTEGFLFRKNYYNSHLREVRVKKIIENGEEYNHIEKNTRAKISEIIINLIENLDLKEEETVHEFLERAFKEEYKVKRKSFLQNKLDSLEKLVWVK